ncbi:hypothetical protein [Geothermobacter hydrogeniphilus]|uniref:hypothetical protein n=1 Tax=Geothermobacter hydrogeniphilus TaxID=1969733 RepID=UPI001557EEFC|nr:hypothetical protein [Geothermobacter hydrogeniphilus]
MNKKKLTIQDRKMLSGFTCNTNGRLTVKKRETHFEFLTDDEVGMENAALEGYARG